MNTRTTGIDAFTSGNIFQKNYKIVIATKRELALIRPVRLAPKVAAPTSIYYAGTVLAQYNGSAGALQNTFVDYNQGGGSGRDTATCILLTDVESQDLSSAASTPLAQALFKGVVLKDSLVGYDGDAKTDLGAKEINDASGVSLVEF